jgi:hypothetical protein
MNPTLINLLANAAPHVARYAGVRELSAVARSYGEPSQDAGTLTFSQAAKFSGISTSIVLATTLAGYAFDKQITETLKLPGGWGPVVGAALGLASTNAVAGLAQGVPASAGYLAGSVGALVPTAIAAYALGKTTSDKTTVTVLTSLAGLTAVVGIARGLTR